LIDNLPESRIKAYEKDWRFLIPVYLVFFLDYTVYYGLLYAVSTGKVAQTLPSFILYAVCYAQPGAINATIGHELFHRKQKIHKIFGTLSYSKMLYSHFYIQHLRSHHKWVSTPLDPSTSRFNESLYAFYLRTIPGGYKETWKIETERLEREGKTQLSIENRMKSFTLLHALYLGVIYSIFGGFTVLFHLAYSFVIVCMLEAINYLEHYGLQRKIDANGNYESVNIQHSWNAP